jgi:uncharacterized membrane-anchored protein YitT (DUF2179 family)
MKKVISIFSVLIGCLIIAISINLILIPNQMITFGIDGIGCLLNYISDINPAFNMLFINLIIILIASIFLDKHVLKVYLLPAILIPLLVFITTPITGLISLNLPEKMLVVLVASFLTGYGYSIIYKQGYSAGTVFLIDEVLGNLTRFHSKMYSWVVDICLLIVSLRLFGYESTLYSLVIIFITRYMITKVRFGINDSKMFYIITSKDKEIKNFIIHDLKYELTVLDVKGGFSKKNNQILLTVIRSNDYFKLKEGIKIIDPKAFIAITETYDVLNRKSF